MIFHSLKEVYEPQAGDALALTNCLIVHPSDFPQGQHVLVNSSYALTVRFV